MDWTTSAMPTLQTNDCCSSCPTTGPSNECSTELYGAANCKSIPTDAISNNANKSTGALVCGIISLIMWLLPIIGLPVSIVGLILGCKNKYETGIILNAIGLVLTIINATVGAVLGAQGKLF